jgi:hypothetical protein
MEGFSYRHCNLERRKRKIILIILKNVPLFQKFSRFQMTRPLGIMSVCVNYFCSISEIVNGDCDIWRYQDEQNNSRAGFFSAGILHLHGAPSIVGKAYWQIFSCSAMLVENLKPK